MRKKLIEVALPLEEINIAAAREKSIRHGHPSTLHLWWARRPLASCRAVLFASIIDDPDQEGVPPALLERIDALHLKRKYAPALHEEPKDEEGNPLPADEAARVRLARERRYKLFSFIENLVQWENSNDPETLATARELILAATDGNPPPVLDPFAGGGSIPLEAQRLGLEAHASDLNPVAVLINKAMIEIPPKFANQPPVNPEARAAGGKDLNVWRGAQGLAEDVRYYGKWMRDEAEKRIGHLYPKAKLPKEYGGGEATVIAWIWARTVASPNPAARGAHVPLVRSFALSTKKGKEAWVEPIVDPTTMTYRFEVRTAQTHPGGKPRGGTIGKQGGVCLLTGTPMDLKYVRTEALEKRMGARLMAVVAEGLRGRIYLAPTEDQESTAAEAVPMWEPDAELPKQALGFRVQGYGMTLWSDLYTKRQMTALSVFSALVSEAREKACSDAKAVNHPTVAAYADALTVYLALGVGRAANRGCSLCIWNTIGEKIEQVFLRSALPMTWDFAEANILSDSTGSWSGSLEWVPTVVERLPATIQGFVEQRDAQNLGTPNTKYLFCTDPPYYDNVPYANLSDFFYLWLRRSAHETDPSLFGTVFTPKSNELVADAFRHGGKEEARSFFERGMGKVFGAMSGAANRDFPITVIYAFKQSESEDGHESERDTPGTASTGWETMLEGLLNSNLQITGTWPMATERKGRMRETGSNALASSIALVCRPRPDDASTVTRREFQATLRSELPDALRKLQQGNIAPVDLAQSAIGPGMAVFSRYKAVLESDGKPMRVRTALQIINQMLDEVVDPMDADSETRWAVDWYRQFGFNAGDYGTAEVLATAKAVSVRGLEEAGLLWQRAGKVKLLTRDELKADYDPAEDPRPTVWEMTQYLARALDQTGIEGAARLLRRYRETKPDAEPERARELCFTLYTVCERKGWAAEARPYNALAMTWSDIEQQSQEPGMEVWGADTQVKKLGGIFADAEE